MKKNLSPHANNMGGANSGNFDRSLNHHYKTLNTGIDTLELGFNLVYKKLGRFHDADSAADFWFMLERCKRDMPDNVNSVLFPRLRVPNASFIFSLQRFGSQPYTYVLKSQYCDILFSRSFDTQNMPPIHVRMSAWGLATFTAGQIVKALRMAFSPWFDIEEAAISRLDYYLDFQGYDFTAKDIPMFMSRARFRPVYPNVNEPETFQFGKGSLVLRIYNKTEEIKANPAKSWTVSTWFNYEGGTVWRVEFQMRREFLKQFNINNLERFSHERLSVLTYCTNWTRHTHRLSYTCHDVTPVNTLVWDYISETLATGRARSSLPKKDVAPQLLSITQSVMGLLVSAGYVLSNQNFEDVFNEIKEIAESEYFSKADFAERVEQRALDRGKPLLLNGGEVS